MASENILIHYYLKIGKNEHKVNVIDGSWVVRHFVRSFLGHFCCLLARHLQINGVHEISFDFWMKQSHMGRQYVRPEHGKPHKGCATQSDRPKIYKKKMAETNYKIRQKSSEEWAAKCWHEAKRTMSDAIYNHENCKSHSLFCPFIACAFFGLFFS